MLVWGDYADDLPFSAFELQSHAGIPNDIAKIVGKRFITASETGPVGRYNGNGGGYGGSRYSRGP